MENIVAQRSITPLEQAAAALTEALSDDPFYCAITVDFAAEPALRKRALTDYFHYSLLEAQRTGRCVLASDASLGAAAWLLPRSTEVDARESSAKSQCLASVLGPRGVENYYGMVRYMAPLARKVVGGDAWYLSIIGILPAAQGCGLGAALLADTLAEAARARATCYAETFNPRNLNFYERLGFHRVASQLEPTTNKEYLIMRREP
jgi:ribosomal protein S18 acetylase RimI-like enzyme